MTSTDLSEQKETTREQDKRDKKYSSKLFAVALYLISGSITVLSASWHVSTEIVGPAFFFCAVLLGFLVKDELVKWCIALGTGLITVSMFWYADLDWVVSACFLLIAGLSLASAVSLSNVHQRKMQSIQN